MTKANDPVFSTQTVPPIDGVFDHPPIGLTKREYFAAMALQGLLSNPKAFDCHAVSEAIYYADELIIQLNPRNR